MVTSKVSTPGRGLARTVPTVLRGAARQARIELRIQLF